MKIVGLWDVTLCSQVEIFTPFFLEAAGLVETSEDNNVKSLLILCYKRQRTFITHCHFRLFVFWRDSPPIGPGPPHLRDF